MHACTWKDFERQEKMFLISFVLETSDGACFYKNLYNSGMSFYIGKL